MARPLVFATRNRGKLVELRALLPGVDVLSIDEAEVRLGRAIPEVVEDAETFAGNAIKKAREVAAATGLPALADDSGLEVDALAGAPGVYSARYAGEGAGDAANTAKLLVALAGVPPEQRTARFRSVLALADPAGPLGTEVVTADGVAEGVVLDAPRGTGGFGYDPVFYFPPLAATFAELGVGPKNDLSHRAQAMRALAPRLLAYLATALWLALIVACSSPTRDTTEATIVVTEPEPATDADPPHVDPPAVKAIGVGEHYSCALLETGEVRCWGAARLGLADQTRPTSIGFTDVVSLGVGDRHACVARADGGVWCWGDNRDGQLGDGTTTERTAPAKVPLAATIVEVVAGGIHTCARDADGAVYCWGDDGAVGHPAAAKAGANLVPGRVAKLAAATRLVAGSDATCAFLADAPPRCWGYNTAGLLGDMPGPALRAVVSPPLARATQVSLGYRTACVIQTGEDVVFCAGTNGGGELGDQDVPDDARCDRAALEIKCRWTDPPPPRGPRDPNMPNLDLPPPPPPPVHDKVFRMFNSFVRTVRVRATSVAAGAGRTCAVTTDANVACWGQMYTNDWSHRRPAVVPSTLGAIAVAVSHEHACAVMKDRSVTCWGFNRSGELGDGTITPDMTPSSTATPVRW